MRVLAHGRFVVASLVLHGALAFVLYRGLGRAPPGDTSPPPPPLGAIEITVVYPPEVPRIASPTARPTNEPPTPIARSRPRRVIALQQHAQGGATPETNLRPLADERRAPIDLLSSSALEKAASGSVAATGPNWGGTTRRVGDGLPEPDSRDSASDREQASGRVKEWVGFLVGRERAGSGNVAPHWREAERRLTESFHPAAQLLNQDNVAKTYLQQVIKSWQKCPPASGPLPRGIDPSYSGFGLPDTGAFRGGALEQTLAEQSGTGDPAAWLKTEVEVIVDEKGAILSARIVSASGRRKYDQAALAAVTKAIEEHRAANSIAEKGPKVTRWSVEAAVAVAPPTAFGFNFDESGSLHPGATGIGKYLDGVYPMQRRVRTHVALLSVAPRS